MIEDFMWFQWFMLTKQMNRLETRDMHNRSTCRVQRQLIMVKDFFVNYLASSKLTGEAN